MSDSDVRPHALPSPGAAFLDSPLHRALVVVALVALALLQNGYVALRFDHVVQLPYLLMEWEPGLYARDWYLQSDPHDRIRFFHLWLIRLAAAPLGLEGGILFLHGAFLAATFGFWLVISKRLFGTAAHGVVVAVLAIFFRGWELGANQLVENIFIPRVEAYAFCYAGLALLLGRRPVLAGLVFALGGLFQPAVPLQFAAVVALWLLSVGERPRLPVFLKFAAAYWVVSLPWMLYLRGTVTGESGLTSEEIVRIFAWIRHPAHMVPSTWHPWRWVASGALLLSFALVWPGLRRDEPAAWRLGSLVPLIGGILAVGTLFIELVPLRWVILFQPWRAAVLLYLALFFAISPRILSYVTSPAAALRVRAAALLVAVTDPRLLVPAVLLELVLTLAHRRDQSVHPRVEVLMWAVLALAVAMLYPWMRRPVLIGVGFAAALTLLRARPGLASPRSLRAGLVGVAILSMGIVALFKILPWERWMRQGQGGEYNAIDRLLMEYQLEVVPIPAIERLGVWIREHTDRDALFVVPPGRQQWGFRLFSRRAQVFDVKSIPYAPPGIEAWWRRSLHHRGIFDPDDPANAEALEEAWSDINARQIALDYEDLTADEMVRLAGMYEADYVITSAEYEDGRLEPVRAEPSPENFGQGKTLHLYRVAEPGEEAETDESAG